MKDVLGYNIKVESLDRITVKEGSIFEILDEIYMMIDVKDRSKFSKISLKFEEDLRNLFEEEK